MNLKHNVGSRGFESLEQRAMLAAGAVLDGTTLTVTGTSAVDTIRVATSPIAGQVAVTINNVSYGSFAASLAKINALGGADAIYVAGIPAQVNGGGGTDQLLGPDAFLIWEIRGKNSGTRSDGVTFSEVERLTTGAGDDRFRFLPGGSLDSRIQGGTGNNTLDYSALSTPITVNRDAKTATHIGLGYSGITTLVGSASTADKLQRPTGYGDWTISGANSGFVSDMEFYGIENLSGGSGGQVYNIVSGGSLSGQLAGGGQFADMISYKYFTPGVTVDLTAGTATAIGGGIVGIRSVEGSTGADKLTGDNNPNRLWGDDGHDFIDGRGEDDDLQGGSGQDIVLGGDGNDYMRGGTGRDILIGGAGADDMAADIADDILIANRADAYDPALSASAYGKLLAIRAEWTRTGLGYSGRVNNLKTGGGLSGGNAINASTVVDDGAVDSLFGGDHLDWFIGTVGVDLLNDVNQPTPEIVSNL